MKIRLIILGLFLTFSLFSQDKIIYSKVKIDILNKDINILTSQGVDVTEGNLAPGKHFISIYNQDEIKRIEKSGFDYEILIEDASAYYEIHGNLDDGSDQITFRTGSCDGASGYDYVTPDNYEMGSMGGYQTYNEILATLANMNAKYPALISPLAQIGNIFTQDNNPILYLKISDNVNVDETDEPEILFTSLHHAREPNSVSQLLFYMWYLLENYDSDPEIKYLVDNTEMYFVPIVNPDGYLYNELTNPNGGGFWRKNRWVDSNGDVKGVDLNRNYGHFWGYDDTGSSPDSDSNVFRGEAPFSEPETQAIRELSETHDFVFVQNYHTSGDLLIHPWGYNDMPTSEDETFKSMAHIMAHENSFTIGTGTETVGYIVNGDSDDWHYGEQITKIKSYAYTPEVGPSFWPDVSSIDQLNKSTMHLNLSTAHLALNYGESEELFGEERLDSRTGTLQFRLNKNGLKNEPLDFSVVSSTPGVILSNNVYNGVSMTQNEFTDFIVNYELEGSVSAGDEITFTTQIDNGLFVFKDDYVKTFRPGFDTSQPISGNDNMDGYSATGEWGISTSEFVSGPSSITDSPNGRYNNGVDSEIVLEDPIDLSNADDATLTFYAKWEIENNYDYVQLQLSADGINYEAACGNYTNTAVPNQLQDSSPLYDGFQTEWVQEKVCLTDYVGGLVYIKFVFHSDGGLREDGFYFDDLNVNIFTETSSSEEVEITGLQVIPNPFGHQFEIKLPDGENYELDYIVRDVSSRIIAYGNLKNGNIINTSDWRNGSYIVSLYDKGKRVVSAKMIKTK